MKLARIIVLVPLTVIIPTAPAAAQAESPSEYTVSFLGRVIDLEPYYQGFPYRSWRPNFDSGKLFYFNRTPEGDFLLVQDLVTGMGSGQIDAEQGRRVHDIDWSTRNFWGLEYDELTGQMIVLADERNDEVINLYRLNVEDGSLTKLTDVPYIYGWDFNKNRETIGYIARYGETEPFRNCLTLYDIPTGQSVEALCEEGSEHRMVWSSVNFRPNDGGVVLKLNGMGERKRGTLAYVDLTVPEPEIELLLPDGIERFSLGTYVENWLDDDRFFYASDESGFENLYVYDLQSRSSRQVTHVEEQAWFRPIVVDGRILVLQTLDRPHENEMVVIDPETGDELGRKMFAANIGILDFDNANHFIISQASAASPFQADEMWITLEEGRAVWTLQPKIRLPERIASAVEQCNVERVEFPTFDVDPNTGESRMLHAFLMTPKNPREDPAERLAVITSFYGGSNVFSNRQNIFCEAGISWLSPAVRGSFGFGKDFAALNDRDLGGDEIVDLFYGARFLEEKLGLQPNQIGVAGGSHGGFATMRALTFPPETNDRNDAYEFGFGISYAGFSSIVSFYHATNIPDWVILEAGDPETEREKLLDRSPIMHVNRLESPILLMHGSNDSRVEVSESRQFVEAVQELNGPVTYVEFEGQGHGISGLANLMRYYDTQFDFLHGVVCGRSGGELTGCGAVP